MSDIVERLRDINADTDAIDRMLDEAAAEIERLRAAARALADKLYAIHDDPRYRSVWTINQFHAGPYTGPNYSDELAALEVALGGIPK